jgi:acylphosphatase
MEKIIISFAIKLKKKADLLQITGFVKNMHDGSVYVEAEGEENDLILFIQWCYSGPFWAKVEKVKQQSAPIQNFESFIVK